MSHGWTPQVSVIVVNWNRKDLLAACLRSLRQQTFHDFEVIVVDNGSTDGSVEQIKQDFPEVQLCVLDHNAGPCVGDNVGIEQARGRYIALLNNDTEAEPRWLEELVKAIEAHPEAGFCASKLVLYDRRDLIDTAGDCFSVAGAAEKRGHLDRADKPEYNCLQEVFGACSGAALYRRAMLDDIGLLDEDLFISFEDVDLSFRAQLKGYKCLYVPQAVVYHHMHGTIQIYSPMYVYHGHRNLEYVYIKNMPLSLMVKYFPLHLLNNLLSFGFFLLKGRGLAFLKGKWDALRALPQLIRKHRQIQKTRSISPKELESVLTRDWWRLKWERWRRIRAYSRPDSHDAWNPSERLL
jgi:GT2 family glycosyltransferase